MTTYCLLDKAKSVSIHMKNIQALALKMSKVAKNLSTPTVIEAFQKRNTVYDLRNHLKLFYLSLTVFFMVQKVFCTLVLKSGT